jgi:aspartokinase-like uncharacterized kinase
MWVVKLGGSLCRSSTLSHWLHTLERRSRDRCVIVPGGGPFANHIRDVHAYWKFDEGTAHLMAVLAMDQYGLMLTGLQPGLIPVRNDPEMRAALNDLKVAVWMPSQMVLRAKELPRSWDMTSDSLAAWLANISAAERLILIKSIDPQAPSIAVAGLAERGVVDPCFEGFIGQGSYAVHMFTRGDYVSFEQWAQGAQGAGTRVVKG